MSTQFLENFLQEKRLLDAAGKPSHERSLRFRQDERLARTLMAAERERARLRVLDPPSTQHQLRSSCIAPPPRKLAVSPLSHWVGPGGAALPLTSWRDPGACTARVLGAGELALMRVAGPTGTLAALSRARAKPCCCGWAGCTWHLDCKARDTRRILLERGLAKPALEDAFL